MFKIIIIILLINIIEFNFCYKISIKFGENIVHFKDLLNQKKIKFYENGYIDDKIKGANDERYNLVNNNIEEELIKLRINNNKMKILNILMNNSISNYKKLDLIDKNQIVNFNNKISSSCLINGGLFNDW